MRLVWCEVCSLSEVYGLRSAGSAGLRRGLSDSTWISQSIFLKSAANYPEVGYEQEDSSQIRGEIRAKRVKKLNATAVKSCLAVITQVAAVYGSKLYTCQGWVGGGL